MPLKIVGQFPESPSIARNRSFPPAGASKRVAQSMPFRDRPRLLKLTFETLEPFISGLPEFVPKTYRLCNSERRLPQKASGGSQPKANLGLSATLTMRPAGRVQSHFCGTSAPAFLKNLGPRGPQDAPSIRTG
jgi:hypothetical protein